MAIKKLIFLIVLSIVLFPSYLFANDTESATVNCDAQCSEIGKWVKENPSKAEEMHFYPMHGQPFSHWKFYGFSSNYAYLFCVNDWKECGAHMCPGTLFQIALSSISCRHMLEIWDSQLSWSNKKYFVFSNSPPLCLQIFDKESGNEIPTGIEFDKAYSKTYLRIHDVAWINEDKLEVLLDQWEYTSLPSTDAKIIGTKKVILNLQQIKGRGN